MSNSSNFTLTRSIRPYLIDIVVFGSITIALIFVAIRDHSAMIILAILFSWLVVVATNYSNTRYRVSFKEGVIECITANKVRIIIKTSDISSVALETSDIKTLLQLNRPTHRVTLYGKNHEYIDVSLKHFVAADIRRLMQEIQNERPDLILPKI
jgi:hypothetical protein